MQERHRWGAHPAPASAFAVAGIVLVVGVILALEQVIPCGSLAVANQGQIVYEIDFGTVFVGAVDQEGGGVRTVAKVGLDDDDGSDDGAAEETSCCPVDLTPKVGMAVETDRRDEVATRVAAEDPDASAPDEESAVAMMTDGTALVTNGHGNDFVNEIENANAQCESGDDVAGEVRAGFDLRIGAEDDGRGVENRNARGYVMHLCAEVEVVDAGVEEEQTRAGVMKNDDGEHQLYVVNANNRWVRGDVESDADERVRVNENASENDFGVREIRKKAGVKMNDQVECSPCLVAALCRDRVQDTSCPCSTAPALFPTPVRVRVRALGHW